MVRCLYAPPLQFRTGEKEASMNTLSLIAPSRKSASSLPPIIAIIGVVGVSLAPLNLEVRLSVVCPIRNASSTHTPEGFGGGVGSGRCRLRRASPPGGFRLSVTMLVARP